MLAKRASIGIRGAALNEFALTLLALPLLVVAIENLSNAAGWRVYEAGCYVGAATAGRQGGGTETATLGEGGEERYSFSTRVQNCLLMAEEEGLWPPDRGPRAPIVVVTSGGDGGSSAEEDF